MEALGDCRRAIGRGVLPAGTDCLTDPATTAARTAGADRAVAPLARACTNAAVAAIAPAGDCEGVSTVADLVACLRTTHTIEAATLLAVADAATGALGQDALRCQTKTVQQARVFATGRLRLLERCKRQPPRDLVPGTSCAEYPKVSARVARLGAKSTRAIGAACATAPLVGPPCRGVADVVACVLDAAADASSAAVAAQFPHAGFCGDAGAAVDARVDACWRR